MGYVCQTLALKHVGKFVSQARLAGSRPVPKRSRRKESRYAGNNGPEVRLSFRLKES